MSKTPFRRVRGLDDRTLASALTNHTQVLQGIVAWVAGQERWRWVWRVWALGITLVVSWLVYEEVWQWLAEHF